MVDADTGAYLPITEMRWGKRTLAWDGWRLKPAKVSDFIPQGKREIFELRTRTRTAHSSDGISPVSHAQSVGGPASDLRAGDRIAVAREIPVFGKTPIPEWEATLLGLMISEGQCDTPGHSPTYTTADPALAAAQSTMAASRGHGRDHLQRSLRVSTGQSKGKRGNRGAKPRPRLAAKSRAQCRRGRQVRAADHLHVARAHGSPVSAGALQRRRQHLSFGGGLFLEYYRVHGASSRTCTICLLRFGVFSLIREETTAIGTRALQDTDHGQGSDPAFCAENRLLTRLGEAARARGNGGSDDRRATEM